MRFAPVGHTRRVTSIPAWWNPVTRWARRLATAVVLLVLGPGLLIDGVSAQRQHMWLADHGVVGTGTVVESGPGYGTGYDWAWVSLQTAGGDVESVYVSPLDEDTNRDVGASIRVRYDPADRTVVEDVNDGSAIFQRWFEIVMSALVTGGLLIAGIRIVRTQAWRRPERSHVRGSVGQP